VPAIATPPIAELKAHLKAIRKGIVQSTTAAASGHPTSSLSAAEVVTALYFGGFLRHDVKNPRNPKRDRFILSKGHAAPVLYSALAEAGYFPKEELLELRKIGSRLEGHPNYRRLDGVEASTGSLGQGLSLGVGHCLATRLDGFDSRTFVMMGDGETGEGQIWEAAMSASKYKLDRLIAIVDKNGYQQTGSTESVLDLSPMAPRWEAFGFHVQEIMGNKLEEVLPALQKAIDNKDRPSVIISHTKKGWPIMDILGADPNHHGKPLTKDECAKALAFIESTDL